MQLQQCVLKNSVSEACRMEETFWKFWYGDDTIVLTYSVMMTIAGLMPFFGKDTDRATEPHPGKEIDNVSKPHPGKDADNVPESLPGKETDSAPETTPGKTADNVAKPNWRKWTGKIGHAKKFLVLLAVSIVLVGATRLYITYVGGAEGHYRNALRFLNGEDGFSINYDIAMTAFEKAGECGHAEAYRHLGEMKMARDDDFAAIKAWNKAVRMGDVASARLLGEFYETTSVELSAPLRKELVYLSYFLGGCLGDEELRRKAERLRFVVSPKTREDGASLCAEISRSRGR